MARATLAAGFGAPPSTFEPLKSVVAHAKKKKGSESSHCEAPRITQHTAQGVGGVRSYIRLVRRREEEERRAKLSSQTTAFRRRKRTREEINEEKEKKLRNEKFVPVGMSFVNLYGTNGKRKPPVLLIDGYNVMFKLMQKEKKRFKGLDLDGMREELEKDLISYSQFHAVKVAVAYDAQGYVGIENGSMEERRNISGLDIFFCFNYEADTGLLKEADRLLEEGTKNIVVVTSDNLVRTSCFKPPSIYVQSTEMFLKEAEFCKEQITETLALHAKRKPVERLAECMGNETISGLADMRQRLAARKERAMSQQEQ